MAARADLLALGQAVTNARIRKGLTQQALASAAGVHEMTIRRVEQGQHGTSIDRLWDIAAALGVPLSRLVSEAEPSTDSED